MGEKESRKGGSSVVLLLMNMEIMAATGPRTFSTAELGACLFVTKKTPLVTDLVEIFFL